MRDNSLIDPEPGFGPAYCFVNQTNFAFIFIRGTVCQCMDLYGTIVRIMSFIANRCFAAGIPNKQGPSCPPADGGPARPCEYYISSLQADLDNLPRCCTDSDRYPWAVSVARATNPTRMSHGGNMPTTAASAARMPFPPTSRWVSTRSPPTCVEPGAGSWTSPPSSGTCPAPITPPVWRRRCLFIAQARREGRSTWPQGSGPMYMICVTHICTLR